MCDILHINTDMCCTEQVHKGMHHMAGSFPLAREELVGKGQYSWYYYPSAYSAGGVRVKI